MPPWTTSSPISPAPTCNPAMITNPSAEPGRARAAMASRSISITVVDFCVQVFAIADAEFRKLRHDPIELATRAVQPTLWLLLFGQVMAQIRGLSGGNGNYLDFLSAGILAQSV